MHVHDIDAERKWRMLPKDIQHKIVNNVFCPKCFDTTIIDYSLHNEDNGIVLKGTCKQCGGKVARHVEDI